MTPDNYTDLEQFLTDPEAEKVIRKTVEESVRGILSVHRLLSHPDLAHVDPEILIDLRVQSYSVYEDCIALNTLLFLIHKDQANDYIRQLFAQLYLQMGRKEDSLKTLCETTITIYAPALWEKITNAPGGKS